MSQEPRKNPDDIKRDEEIHLLRKSIACLFMERNRMESDLAFLCKRFNVQRAHYPDTPPKPNEPAKVEPVFPPTPLLDAVKVLTPDQEAA